MAAVFLTGVFSASAGSLIDVAFTTASATSKTGFAATGVTTNDFWNTCTINSGSGTLANFDFVDGSASGAGLTVLNVEGVYGNGASDPMYGTYLDNQGGDITVTVTGLLAGTYDFYLYGHGNGDNQNSIFQITEEAQSYGSEETTNGPGWLSSVWQEGVQYVEFTNVSVYAGETMSITVAPGAGGYAVLSGLQMAYVGPLSNNPFIATPPTNETAIGGSNASFSVVASGPMPLAYQWQFEGTNLPAATNATLLLSNINKFESGSYAVLVSNMYGSSLSVSAVLTIVSQIITSQPQPASQTVAIGQNISYSVGVATVAPVSYQWRFDRTNLAGATSATLTLNNVMRLNSGTYAVLVSNAYGTTTSASVTLTVVADSVSTQSLNQSLYDAFLLASTAMIPLGTAVWFQWGATTNYGLVTPATTFLSTNSFSISNLVTGLTPYSVYHYQAVASNIYGTFLGGDVSFTTVPRFVQVGTNTGWSALVLSGDGRELVATSNGMICVSTNLGITFTPTTEVGSVFAVSSNGATILAVSGSNIYVSTNRGSTWATNTAPAAFTRFAASSSGQNVVASDGSVDVYTSANYGATWSGNTVPIGPSCLASSSDGSQLYAGAHNEPSPDTPLGWVYDSKNSGSTWNTSVELLSQTGLGSIACSASGATVALAEDGVEVSTNGGASWTQYRPPLGPFFIALSANGQTMISSGDSQGYQVSPNAGVSWYTPNPPYLSGAVMSSSDGNTLATLDSYNDLIYLSLPPPSQPSALSVPAYSSQGVPTFQLTGQAGYTYIIEASTDLVNWADIATLVNTNGTVTFSDPSSTNYPQRFYRAVAP